MLDLPAGNDWRVAVVRILALCWSGVVGWCNLGGKLLALSPGSDQDVSFRSRAAGP